MERLRISIYCDEFNATNAFSNHAIERISSASTNTDDFYFRTGFDIGFNLRHSTTKSYRSERKRQSNHPQGEEVESYKIGKLQEI